MTSGPRGRSRLGFGGPWNEPRLGGVGGGIVDPPPPLPHPERTAVEQQVSPFGVSHPRRAKGCVMQRQQQVAPYRSLVYDRSAPEGGGPCPSGWVTGGC